MDCVHHIFVVLWPKKTEKVGGDGVARGKLVKRKIDMSRGYAIVCKARPRNREFLQHVCIPLGAHGTDLLLPSVIHSVSQTVGAHLGNILSL